MQNKTLYTIAIMRISLGFLFLWAFLDKTFGLGFATLAKNSWLNGGSPTSYYLSKVVMGPFADLYHSIAGNVFVDWLFMAGLLGIGVSLMLGIFTRIGAIAGIVLSILLYATTLPKINNPFFDDHICYIMGLLIVLFEAENQKLSLKNLFSKKIIENT
jgi:thiosulfate dehydrogenase [quinone] large subunit